MALQILKSPSIHSSAEGTNGATFNNVVLKDDLLTLDFKSNKLLQRETIDEEGDAEEDEFNDLLPGNSCCKASKLLASGVAATPAKFIESLKISKLLILEFCD